jgi:hypothetical protein
MLLMAARQPKNSKFSGAARREKLCENSKNVMIFLGQQKRENVKPPFKI